MHSFKQDVLEAAAREREVVLTTVGRQSGKPKHVTIWVSTDGRRIFIRSGAGPGRHWPQNLLARGEGVLLMGGKAVRFKPRHVTDPDEARLVSQLARKKYGSYVEPSTPSEPLTPGEQATFELLPVTES
ncbi:DUF2255 family protein [bacterium]|nr:MAG: DUF2255 family protein [bacterium]